MTVCLDTSGDPFANPLCGRAILHDLSILARLHQREVDCWALRALIQDGFPDGVSLPLNGPEAALAVSDLRSTILPLTSEASCLRLLARDYQATYMAPCHLDEAGRMVRRGDRFVSCLNVVLQLASDAQRRGGGGALADYLDRVFLPQLASFRAWVESRGRSGFYGVVAAFSDVYCRELRRRLGSLNFGATMGAFSPVEPVPVKAVKAARS